MTSMSKGSLWHRWDPHIHTPATLLANEFEGDWDAYLKAVEQPVPAVEALGITEYCILRGYKEFKEHQAKRKRGHSVTI